MKAVVIFLGFLCLSRLNRCEAKNKADPPVRFFVKRDAEVKTMKGRHPLDQNDRYEQGAISKVTVAMPAASALVSNLGT